MWAIKYRQNRTALGLAGVSLKAGARSALATLWSVNDKATSERILEFYRHLHEGQISKAQVKRIHHCLYKHPYLWSPFLLIGNWL